MNAQMRCPECGTEMNHHAEKVIYSEGAERLVEFHQCPNCGASGSRTAEKQVY